MNRGAMRTMLRDRVRDTRSTEWPDTTIDTELDVAAQDVSIMLADNAQVNWGRREFSIAGGTGKVYPLYDVNDFHSVRKMVGGATGVGGRWIGEGEGTHKIIVRPTGVDKDGRYLYSLRHMPDVNVRLEYGATPTTGSFKVTFDSVESAAIGFDDEPSAVQTILEAVSTIGVGNVEVAGKALEFFSLRFKGELGGVHDLPAVTATSVSLGGVTVSARAWRYEAAFLAELPTMADNPLVLLYRIVVASIPTGSTFDTRSYSVVPVQFHELVVESAAIRLLGHSGGMTLDFVQGLWARLMGQAGLDASKRGDAKFLNQ